ncbi:MAG: hypothetical protein Q9226_005490 [Calogaya cf. arnoldii]
MPPTSGSILETNDALSNTLSVEVPTGNSSPTPTSQAPAWRKRRLSPSHATSTVELPESHEITLGAVEKKEAWEHREQQAEITDSQDLNDDGKKGISKKRPRAMSEGHTRSSKEFDPIKEILDASINAKMGSSNFDPQTWSTRDPAENFISTWEGRLGKYPHVRDALQGLSKFRTLPSEDEELPLTPFRELNLMMDYVSSFWLKRGDRAVVLYRTAMLKEMLIFSDIMDKQLQLIEDSTYSAGFRTRVKKLLAEGEAVDLVEITLGLASQDEEENSHFQQMFARHYDDRYLILAPYLLFGCMDGITAMVPFFSHKEMFRTSEYMVALVEIVNLLKPEFLRTEQLHIYAQAIDKMLIGQRLTDEQLDQLESYSSEVQRAARTAEGHRINAETYLSTLKDSSQTLNDTQPSPLPPTSGSPAADSSPENAD